MNTSRAELIALGNLLEVLNNGRPGKAAIDVFYTEPMGDSDDPLLSHPNLIVNLHIGFVTGDEFDLQFANIFDQLNADNAPIHMINPAVWTSVK